jgi:class 3 adenylate cyclase/tetratricopeptide (TPR) repeat protein
MQCPRCQHENPPQSKFCFECGARLALTCGICGTEIPAGAKFCNQCGQPVALSSPPQPRFATPEAYTPRHLAEKILTSKAALEGERKQVTVLFADLKGSMELLADRDPEEARKILDPVLERMMEAVHRYEGTVNQVMGDGIMALFGAPLAHEDHAVRACYAALRMQESVSRYGDQLQRGGGSPVYIRVGLNSGEVVVRSVGNDLHMDYSAVGETTHLAARMEQLAKPGSILASASTVRLAEGYVEVTPLGPKPIKGLDDLVDVYAVTGRGQAHSALEAAERRGLTPFVGRDAELAQLSRAFERVAEGHGQVVGVVGEPGVGKSRLIREFTRSDRMHGWLFMKTAAASYGKATAYGPVIDMLRSYFKIHDRDDPQDVREKITTRALALDEGHDQTRSAILALLDVPVDSPEWQGLDRAQRRQRTMEAVRHLLFRESKTQPLCLVIEDLHWIDSETQAFLDSLIESLPSLRLLLLVNFRPEYRHDWGSKTYYTQVRVDSLPPATAEDLLRALLGDDLDLAPLKRLLIDRTQGNPFFLEESARTLVENGVLVGERGAYRPTRPVETIQVPGSVQAVLAARIDRLAPEDKRLLQSASVIGETVPLGLLQAITTASEREVRDSLGRLRAAEFLHDVNLFPEPEYAFRHGLMCRVAYDSLLREQRRALHARVADAIERLYADRLTEHVEQLAHHALQGELWDQAARSLREAGAKAFSRSANREAVVWFGQALEALGRLPETSHTLAETADVHLGLRNALTLLGEHERTLAHLREAQALAERIGDRHRLGRALAFEVNCLFLLGQHEDAVESGRRARAVAEALGDVALRTVTDMYAGRAHLYLGDFPRAIEIFGGIVATLTGELAHEHLGLPILPSVFARSHLVEALAEVGRFEEGARCADEAIALAERTRHPDTLLWAYHGAGVHHLAQGEVRRAAEVLERAYSVCQSHDMPAYVPRISAELGLAWALGGRAAEAVPMLERAVEQAASRKQATSHSQVLLLLGEVCLLAGPLGEAADAATHALALFRRQGERGHEAWTLRLLGDIVSREAPGDAARAEAYYRAATALATILGMRPLVARCDLGLGLLLRQTGQREGAALALRSACTRFREVGMASALARSEAELEALRG